MEKDILLSPKQQDAIAIIHDAKFSLLVGGSRSGKTFVLCYFICVRAMAVKSRHAILRFHFNDVKRSVGMDTLPKILEMRGIAYTLNKSDWVFSLSNGSEIWLGGLDDKQRVEKILGNEYSTIYINEASQVSFLAYTTALTRLAENTGVLHNKVFIDCNPPEKSHWLYKMFVLHKQPETEQDLEKSSLYGVLQMNPTDNPYLSPDYIRDVLETLPDRQKRRFLYGEWLEKRQGALWNFAIIERYRVNHVPTLTYAGVAVDPAITSNEDSDETGIVWGGMSDSGDIYIIGDVSMKGTPYQWASKAVSIYSSQYLDFIAGETNQGGDMVASTVRSVDERANFVPVRATRGKALRAEPVVALYEQGRVHHVGNLPELEEQLCEWSPEDYAKSPDRLDALVWLVTVLLEKGKVSRGFNASFGGCFTHLSNGRNRPPVFGKGIRRFDT